MAANQSESERLDVTVATRIRKSEFEDLQAHAAAQDRKPSSLLRRILIDWLAAQRVGKEGER